MIIRNNRGANPSAGAGTATSAKPELPTPPGHGFSIAKNVQHIFTAMATLTRLQR